MATPLTNISRVDDVDSFYPITTRGFVCPYCGRESRTQIGRERHINLAPPCRARHMYILSCENTRKQKREPDADVPPSEPAGDEPPRKRARIEADTPPVSRPSSSNAEPAASAAEDVDHGDGGGYYCNKVFVEPFPVSTAGAPIGTRRYGEEDLREYLDSCGRLGDRDLFTTAEIMMSTGLTGPGRTQHLNGPIYKQSGKEVWKNNAELLEDIDGLPKGPSWTTAEVSAGEGAYKRTYTVHFRNILDLVRRLIGARRFRDGMRYAPERHWTSRHKRCRVYDEMWSGNWWWRMQYLIRDKSGTVVPLIIASDATTLTNNAQGPKAHPVYISIGNIVKSVRRRPTKHAMLLVGYIPVDSFEDVPGESTQRRYRTELLHRSLEKIFEPLKTASSDGIFARCADGYVRHIYPIIAAWIADWPEQNDIAGTTQSGCPKCRHKRKGRGRGGRSAPLRDPKAMRAAFGAYRQTGRPAVLKPLLLQPCIPFWLDIPHVDIGASLAPDLLHQLYKGMFEHMRDWVEQLLGTKEFNQRFKSMPTAQGLRYFKNGVTTVNTWTGRESREMMRQFLPVAIDAQAPADFIRMIRALLDFSYLAHSAQLTDKELTEMGDALAAFHKAKHTLLDEEIFEDPSRFDLIAKLHMLGHYPNDIRELGVPDGYSTETPEHLHIVYVKIPWRMSSRRDPLPQMVKYVRRVEAIRVQRTFIDEYYGEREGADEEEIRKYAEAERNTDEERPADEESEDGEDDKDGENGEDSEVIEVEGEEEASAIIHYPRPAISIAREPTVRHVPGHVLISSYGASGLVPALALFISATSKSDSPHDEIPLILPSEHFDVWHKATFNHGPLPFAPAQPCHRDVVRVQPPVRDSAGRIKKPGVFDTVLFTTDRSGFGLNHYRAGCVRAIFSLPTRLQYVHAGPLVLLDIFSTFEPDPTATHLSFRTVPARSNGSRASIVLPLERLAMACHVAPDFSSPPSPDHVRQRLIFNEFFNHFTFLLMAYWRRMNSDSL